MPEDRSITLNRPNGNTHSGEIIGAFVNIKTDEIIVLVNISTTKNRREKETFSLSEIQAAAQAEGINLGPINNALLALAKKLVKNRFE